MPLTGNATFTALFEVDTGPEPSVVHAWDFEAEVFAIASYSLGGGVLTAEFVGTGAWEREADSQSFFERPFAGERSDWQHADVGAADHRV